MKLLKITTASLALALPAYMAYGAGNRDAGSGAAVNQGTAQSGDMQAGSQVSLDSSTIREAQRALNNEGFDVSADGVIGPTTKQALREYQSNNDLPQTGNLDAATLSSLGVSYDRAPASVPPTRGTLENRPGSTGSPGSTGAPGTPGSPDTGTTGAPDTNPTEY